MKTTNHFAIPYPEGSDHPKDMPSHIKGIAEAVDNVMYGLDPNSPNNPTLTARVVAIESRFNAFQQAHPDHAPVTVALASPFTTQVGSPVVSMKGGIILLALTAFRAGWAPAAPYSLICTLPAWARPATTITALGAWGNVIEEIKVYPDGRVTGSPQGATVDGASATFMYPSA